VDNVVGIEIKAHAEAVAPLAGLGHNPLFSKVRISVVFSAVSKAHSVVVLNVEHSQAKVLLADLGLELQGLVVVLELHNLLVFSAAGAHAERVQAIIAGALELLHALEGVGLLVQGLQPRLGRGRARGAGEGSQCREGEQC